MRDKILQFLYEQVKANKIPQIKKGMVEEFEEFISNLIASKDENRVAEKMMEKMTNSKKEVDNENW